MNAQFKKQHCYVVGLALGWIGYAVGLAYFSYQRQWVVALLWMAGVPCLRWALFYFFRYTSRFLGYGRIADKFAPVPPPHANPSAAPVAVNFGIQVPVALRSPAWKSDGTFEAGAAVTSRENHGENLCFDGATPVTRVLFNGKLIDFELDSGEQSGSQLWTPFADDFTADCPFKMGLILWIGRVHEFGKQIGART